MEPCRNIHIERDRPASRQVEPSNSLIDDTSKVTVMEGLPITPTSPFLHFIPPNLGSFYDHYGEPLGASGDK